MYKGKVENGPSYSSYAIMTTNQLIRIIYNHIESANMYKEMFYEINNKNEYLQIEYEFKLFEYERKIDNLERTIFLLKNEINSYKQEKKNKISTQEVKTYIIKDDNTGLYKIGKSINPRIREKTLQSEKPNIKIIKVFNKNIEKKLHNEYKDFRIRGEWFNLSPIQVKYICTKY
jgi:hypothetical protein